MLGALASLRDAGRLRRRPRGLLLISPAVDLSDRSCVARRATGTCGGGNGGAAAPAPAASSLSAASSASTLSECDGAAAAAPLRPSSSCSSLSSGRAATTAAAAPPADANAAAAGAAAAAAAACDAAGDAGYYDYLPRDLMADGVDYYYVPRQLASDPLVSPTYLKSFRGLAEQEVLVTCGGAEVRAGKKEGEEEARGLCDEGVRLALEERGRQAPRPSALSAERTDSALRRGVCRGAL